MKKRSLTFLLATVALSAGAFTVMATLVGSRQGTSVTGQMITICTYTYNNQHFDKIFPMGTNCPISIQLQ